MHRIVQHVIFWWIQSLFTPSFNCNLKQFSFCMIQFFHPISVWTHFCLHPVSVYIHFCCAPRNSFCLHLVFICIQVLLAASFVGHSVCVPIMLLHPVFVQIQFHNKLDLCMCSQFCVYSVFVPFLVFFSPDVVCISFYNGPFIIVWTSSFPYSFSSSLSSPFSSSFFFLLLLLKGISLEKKIKIFFMHQKSEFSPCKNGPEGGYWKKWRGAKNSPFHSYFFKK